jgi:hypothetical protein
VGPGKGNDKKKEQRMVTGARSTKLTAERCAKRQAPVMFHSLYSSYFLYLLHPGLCNYTPLCGNKLLVQDKEKNRKYKELLRTSAATFFSYISWTTYHKKDEEIGTWCGPEM